MRYEMISLYEAYFNKQPMTQNHIRYNEFAVTIDEGERTRWMACTIFTLAPDRNPPPFYITKAVWPNDA